MSWAGSWDRPGRRVGPDAGPKVVQYWAKPVRNSWHKNISIFPLRFQINGRIMKVLGLYPYSVDSVVP